MAKISIINHIEKAICLKTEQQTHTYFNFIVILSPLMGEFPSLEVLGGGTGRTRLSPQSAYLFEEPADRFFFFSTTVNSR